jgi:transposase InsO family protein
VIRGFVGYAFIVVASLRALLRTRREQAVVELALRQQLATDAHKQPRPRLSAADRGFWIALLRRWPRWRSVLVVVQPETVVRWDRKGFRLYGRSVSRCGPGRPRISPEVQQLIRRLAAENPWRARRIQAELEKLGIKVSLATVSRYLTKRGPDEEQRQRWTTFLRNHRDVISAMDFMVVPTVRFKLHYVWFVIGHGRRSVLHVNVAAHPTSAWVIQQLREAFPDQTSILFLVYDNDSIFSDRVLDWIEQLGIEPKPTALRSPWQNGRAERWIGTTRRELPDHVVPTNEKHLRRVLLEYVEYDNRERVHTRLRDSPTGRPVEERPSSHAQVVGLPRPGGLHHRYAWRQAA